MSKHETQLIDGRALARQIRSEAAREIQERDLHPGLGVILVGDDPASHLYVRLKEKACAEAGIRFEKRLFPEDVAEETIVETIHNLNTREDIDAILIQLPLPEHLDTDRIISEMDPGKDADGFHPDAVLTPGLATGILMLAEASGKAVREHSLFVLANSRVFAKPIESLFLKHGAKKSGRLELADFVVTATGKPHSLKKGMIKPGAVVIDVGTTRVGEKVVGDADDLTGIASAVTPVPGGVGPVTVAMLIRNTAELAKRHQ